MKLLELPKLMIPTGAPTMSLRRLAERAVSTGVALLLIEVPVTAAENRYTITNAGTSYLVGDWMRGEDFWVLTAGLNDLGQGVALAGPKHQVQPNEFHAVLLQNDRLVDCGTLGGSVSQPFAINGRGQVVGSSLNGLGTYEAFIYEAGVMRSLSDLVSPGSGWQLVSAETLNDRGQVAGRGERDNQRRAFFLTPGPDWTIVDLGELNNQTLTPLGMNEEPKVVGRTFSEYSGFEEVAFVWSDGTVAELRALGYGPSAALAINEDSQIVGYSSASDGALHAALWQGGEIADLGVLPGQEESVAASINDQGQIVGWSGTTGGSHEPITRVAVLWTNGELIDLNTVAPVPSGWTLTNAVDINEAGQILGDAIVSGQARGFLLTPLSYAAGDSASAESAGDASGSSSTDTGRASGACGVGSTATVLVMVLMWFSIKKR